MCGCGVGTQQNEHGLLRGDGPSTFRDVHAPCVGDCVHTDVTVSSLRACHCTAREHATGTSVCFADEGVAGAHELLLPMSSFVLQPQGLAL